MTKIFVVCGFPGSGKTSYIKKHIKKNDLVFDYDEIQAVLTFQPKHLENQEVKPYLIDILKNMIKMAKNDNQINTLWIIRTVPDESFQSLLQGCDVEFLYINKTVFECLDQISNDPERNDSDKNWYVLLMNLQNEFMKGAFKICTFVND
ncbi:hypothetical protein [[Ruminococcus] torques]|uniref:hypothetical protein n=1 Tax=[Ruminococcus] torques TaxID=33039 RepID=UPI0012BC6B07|nr:hypothetical protein [[Ruminococcus] torques]MTS46423.1 hypothetical protein [[Ruminococcus] torques]